MDTENYHYQIQESIKIILDDDDFYNLVKNKQSKNSKFKKYPYISSEYLSEIKKLPPPKTRNVSIVHTTSTPGTSTSMDKT